MAGPLRGGRVDKGRTTKKKGLFRKLEKKIRKNVTTKLEGGGGLGPEWSDHKKEELFCGFPKPNPNPTNSGRTLIHASLFFITFIMQDLVSNEVRRFLVD